jgi:23S rRNA pseudouridine2605 synthase
MEERLQKILATAGFGSRRACEDMIIAGRVSVNGQVARIGAKADLEKDQVRLDGKLVTLPDAYQYIALYKPKGVISAVTSPDPRPTVRDLVPTPGKLYPVGRLDVDSEGLILLTNDGELANKLTHPRYGHEKEYRVLVARHPDEKQLAAWSRGVVLDNGYRTAPVKLIVEAHENNGTRLRVIMKEGRKRQIRETCQLIGLPVVSIIRIRIGNLRLGNLKPREWRYLKPVEIKDLLELTSGKSNLTRKSKHHRQTSKTTSGNH